jgi:hypothetical protein
LSATTTLSSEDALEITPPTKDISSTLTTIIATSAPRQDDKNALPKLINHDLRVQNKQYSME